MCGLAGFVEAAGGRSAAELGSIAAHMAEALVHRGPDDRGTWVDAETGVALGHRRLAVIDLSPEGRQPMASRSGRFHLILNGEIYNFAELRAELEGRGVAFRGRSDTEIFLAGIEEWGLVPTLHRSVGMFAFAAWDGAHRTLHLGRDRLGEKPLYHGFQGKAFLFASELKALHRHPSWIGEVDRGALSTFMRLAYVPAPWSIHRGIRTLPPGTVLSLTHAQLASGAAAVEAVAPVPYWSALAAARAGLDAPFEGSASDATNELERLLTASVRAQSVADVPVGAFLSGGIDSTTVVALMAATGRRVRTFSIGYQEAAYDEAAAARAVAQHLGTEHEELVVTPKDAMAVIPRLPDMYDEPFADPSQVPTHLVAGLARRHVTVSLSGDGGDELFAGYARHAWMRNLWALVGWLPAPARRMAAALAQRIPQRAWARVLRTVGPLAPAAARKPGAGAKVHRLAAMAAATDSAAAYRRLISHWQDPAQVVVGGHEQGMELGVGGRGLPWRDLVEEIGWLDLVTYLPHDILVKVDRACMAVSLESRVPLLDHRVVELALRLPPRWKMRHGRGKWILREVLSRHVPRRLWDRPKSGFGLPIDVWLRGPLREWAEGLLAPDRLASEGYLEAAPIRVAWEQHLTGSRSHHYRLWNALMFCAWRERWG